MSIEFQHPWFLLLLIPLAAAAVIPFVMMTKRRRKKPGASQKTALALRLAAFLLAVLLLSGFTAVRKTDRNSVIVVADLSDSTKPVREDIESLVKEASRYAGRDKKTEVGLLTFGYDSYYEIPLSYSFSFDRFETAPAGNYTDIYSALLRAAAMMPSDTNRRIILITDGKENIGQVREAADVLLRRGIRTDAIVRETVNAGAEVQLTDIRTTETVYDGESFAITVTVESTVGCEAVLRLYCDTSLAAEQTVRLTSGTNRFVFKDTAEAAGIVTYTAEIVCTEDGLGRNNRVYTFVRVLGTPRILVVDGTGEESHELLGILGDSAEADVVSPAAVPNDISGLRSYNAVVLMNTGRNQLPEGWDSLLEVYVRQLGRGVFTTGGSHAYAVGGWDGSDLEKILPVDMTKPDKAELYEMSLMLLIDNSGSMGSGPGSALELAKQGAANAVDALRAFDEVGVIAFSDNAVWVSKPDGKFDPAQVKSKIRTIPPGGGTMVNAALEQAYSVLASSGKSLKTVILLTDGSPADGEAVLSGSLIRRMQDANITVSSIAVGEFTELGLLNTLANSTGGGVTEVERASDLPSVIFNETVKAINNLYVVNRTFLPAVGSYSTVLEDVGSLPEVDGFILTGAKDLARTVLLTDTDDPLLSVWQYGLGKTVSLMTDVNGKWSSKLLASEDGRKLVANALSYVLPDDDNESGGSVTVKREGDKGVIVAQTPGLTEGSRAEAVVISPGGKESTVALVPTGITEFSGDFLLEEEGSYVVIVNQTDENGSSVMNRENALAVRYSDEYDLFREDTGSVAALCAGTGGSADFGNIGDIMKIRIDGNRESLNFTLPFIIATVLLVMADIAIRRLGILDGLAAKIKEASAERSKKKREKRADNGKEKAGAAAAAASGGSGFVLAEKKGVYTPAAEREEPGKRGRKKAGAAPEKDRKAENESSPVSAVSSLLKAKEDQKRKKL